MDSIDFDSLGKISKEFESQGTSLKFPPGGLLIARLDGRSFHSFTKGFDKPFDKELNISMTATTKALCEEFSATIGYTQSDEITLIWDLTKPRSDKSQFMFDGKAHKLNSVLAGFTAVTFNGILRSRIAHQEKYPKKPGLFDCRIWPVPDRRKAIENLIWRQWDAEKNSINSLACCYYSPFQLHGRSTKERIEMLRVSGISWADYPNSFKFGTLVLPKVTLVPLDPAVLERIPEKYRPEADQVVERTFYETYSFNLRQFKDIAEIESTIFTK